MKSRPWPFWPTEQWSDATVPQRLARKVTTYDFDGKITVTGISWTVRRDRAVHLECSLYVKIGERGLDIFFSNY